VTQIEQPVPARVIRVLGGGQHNGKLFGYAL